MKRQFTSCFAFVLFAISASSAHASDTDAFFKGLTGCFRINFHYFEKGIQHIDGLYEWIYPVKGSPTNLQHLGIVEEKDGDIVKVHAFKHWREEWHKNSDGTAYQKVVGPREDFRYECSAKIEFNQWRCAVANAPKPRRDQGREDYETLDRENTLQITSEGWVQNENNTKRDKNGNIVSKELGWNTYERVDESFCKAAKELQIKLEAPEQIKTKL